MEHIIGEEILFRLSVKTLSRFKCVCKRWLGLIESRSFIDHHYSHESDGHRKRLVLRYYYLDKPTQLEESIDLIPPPKFPHSEKTLELMGPQLGLFCQVNLNGDITLFNPATRMFKRVPPLESLDVPLELLDVPPRKRMYGFGFGLDPLTRDYKIIVFPQPLRDPTTSVCVYNSTSDSWKSIKARRMDSMNSAFMSKAKTFVNGVYYWLAPPRSQYHGPNRKLILAFDVRIEKFQEIQLPANDDIVFRKSEVEICRRGDSLALLAFDVEWADLWVMGEEGVWTRSFRIGPFEKRIMGYYPYCMWKNEVMLVSFSYFKDYMFLIDVSTLKRRTIVIPPQIPRSGGFDIPPHSPFFYQESLVSIKGESSYDPSPRNF